MDTNICLYCEKPLNEVSEWIGFCSDQCHEKESLKTKVPSWAILHPQRRTCSLSAITSVSPVNLTQRLNHRHSYTNLPSIYFQRPFRPVHLPSIPSRPTVHLPKAYPPRLYSTSAM
ncbi:hypothetical protein DM01DRAFT_1382824 [Hesseltinella vesiculosa]|uniref:Uncharacterized protein n=1 Tax=Hesseltinella vesiculosa TaxID=101127 RepID=A0A1X2GK79_9FUNG|nr:hypothetical protein DM01DRAFT_1382824 [Hesseltinella vesiculosa]